MWFNGHNLLVQQCQWATRTYKAKKKSLLELVEAPFPTLEVLSGAVIPPMFFGSVSLFSSNSCTQNTLDGTTLVQYLVVYLAVCLVWQNVWSYIIFSDKNIPSPVTNLRVRFDSDLAPLWPTSTTCVRSMYLTKALTSLSIFYGEKNKESLLTDPAHPWQRSVVP